MHWYRYVKIDTGHSGDFISIYNNILLFSAASDRLVMEFYWICNCCFVSFYNILIIWDLFFNQRHRGLGRKSLNTINRSQSYDLLITIHNALQLSYRRLLGAKATKGHFNTSSPRHKIYLKVDFTKFSSYTLILF